MKRRLWRRSLGRNLWRRLDPLEGIFRAPCLGFSPFCCCFIRMFSRQCYVFLFGVHPTFVHLIKTSCQLSIRTKIVRIVFLSGIFRSLCVVGSVFLPFRIFSSFRFCLFLGFSHLPELCQRFVSSCFSNLFFVSLSLANSLSSFCFLSCMNLISSSCCFRFVSMSASIIALLFSAY